MISTHPTDRAKIEDGFLAAMRALVHGEETQTSEALTSLRPRTAAFMEFLVDHRLVNLAYQVLASERLRDAAGAEFVEQLQQRQARRPGHRTRLRQAQLTIARQLQAARIEFLVMKGFAFEARLCPPHVARHQYDLDLLVQPTDVSRAVAALQTIGLGNYELTHNPAVSPHRLATEYEIELKADGLTVDLHWKFRGSPGYRIDYAQLWNNRVEFTLDGMRLSTLCDADTAALLALSIAHDIGRGACRLKHFVDLYLTVKGLGPQFDWSAFMQQRHAERTDVLCRESLAMLCDLFPQDDTLEPLAVAIANGERHSDVVQLLENPRGCLENQLWLNRRCPTAPLSTATWYLRRGLVYPQRIPFVAVRRLRFAVGAATAMFGRMADQAAGRNP